MSLTKIQQTLRAEQIPRSKSFLFKLTSVSTLTSSKAILPYGASYKVWMHSKPKKLKVKLEATKKTWHVKTGLVNNMVENHFINYKIKITLEKINWLRPVSRWLQGFFAVEMVNCLNWFSLILKIFFNCCQL